MPWRPSALLESARSACRSRKISSKAAIAWSGFAAPRSPNSRRSAACRRGRQPTSARRRISCSRACPRPRRSTTPCRVRQDSCKRQSPDRSSSSSARIRCRTRSARSRHCSRRARNSSTAKSPERPAWSRRARASSILPAMPRPASRRSGSSPALPIPASISASSAPRAGSSWSIICWSRSISRRPRKPWRSGSRPASTCR